VGCPETVTRLGTLLDLLEHRYGPQSPPPCRGAYQMVLWELIAYLQPDDRRLIAYQNLERKIGCRQQDIRNASYEALLGITRLGGIAAEERAWKLKQSAEVICRLEKKALMRFPSIGEPGAEKILLFTETVPVVALESNGLRVLSRLGYTEEKRNYAATYRSAQAAAAEELPPDFDSRKRAFLVLRRHGQELCRTREPACRVCPLKHDCPSS
jgi:endonuclease III